MKASRKATVALLIVVLLSLNFASVFAIEGDDNVTADLATVSENSAVATASGTNSISVEWNIPGEDIAKYEISGYGNTVTVGSSVTKYVYNSLSAGVYSFTVTAKDALNQTVGSQVTSNGVLLTDIKATYLNDSSATVVWTPVTEASSYSLRVLENGMEKKNYTGVTDASKTVSDLQKDHKYRYEVTAIVAGKSYVSAVSSAFILAPSPDAVANLTYVPSYESVKLCWDANDDADGYYITKSTSENSGYSFAGLATNEDVETRTVNGIEVENVTKVVPEVKELTKYYFRVYAYKGSIPEDGSSLDNAVLSEPQTITGASVRPIVYKMKIKKTCTLTSHDAVPVKQSFKKGTWLQASRFSSGKYIFTYNGHLFYATKARVTSVSAEYTSTYDYTPEAATLLVNEKGLTSSTNQLIWVSTYCQRVYIFTRENPESDWVYKKSFEVATGKATSPTPTGESRQKAIWKHIKRRNNLPYWSCFSSYNSFHGKFKSWKVGKPISGGCVRNLNDNAKYIYQTVPMNSKVFLY